MIDYEDYNAALKKGERSYREHLSRGQYPYLQILGEQLNHANIVNEQQLGLQEIPSDAIIGTFSSGRRTSFAPNFMPLLQKGTEFSSKWSNLCAAHLTEGIHDPVTVYEYLHHYFVVEGNKRVSVLKYFDSPRIPAYVTRLIPERRDTKESIVYYEFLEFYKMCPVNFLIFSEPGSYDKFLNFVGKAPEEPWSDEEKENIRSAFVRFDQAFTSLGGKKLEGITSGDALLSYLHYYPYKDSVSLTPDEHRENLLKIWEEIRLLGKEETVKFVFSSEETPHRLLDMRVKSAKHLRIAFVHQSAPDVSSWTYGHDLGRIYIEEAFGDQVSVSSYYHVETEEEGDAVLEKIIKGGIDVIFATSTVLIGSCLKAAAIHPEVKILCCAINSAHRYIRTYYARTFESKFLAGLIAGAMTDSGDIGFLTGSPIYPNIANINAFAIGVQMVRPDARVHVQWTSRIGEDPKKYFWEHGVGLICGREIGGAPDGERDFGLYRFVDGQPETLAASVFNWGILYRKIIDSIRDGSWSAMDKTSGRKALNYWWGMESDVVDFIVGDKVPLQTAHLVDFMKTSMRNLSFAPFYGKIRSQDGFIHTADSHLSIWQVMAMNWLNDNVIGSIPTMEELTEYGQSIMIVQGSNRSAEVRAEEDERKVREEAGEIPAEKEDEPS